MRAIRRLSCLFGIFTLQARSKLLSIGDAIMPLRIACLSLLGWSLFAGTVLAAPSAWKTDFDSARIEAQKSQRPLLVHFYSDSCAPCVHMEQKVLHQAAIEEYIQGNLVAVSVNVDQHSDLQKRFNINRWPCDFVLNPSGTRRLATSVGPRTLADYHQMLVKSVAWHNQRVALLEKLNTQTSLANITPGTDSVNSPAPKFTRDNLILDGYSPVSLLTDRKWIKGTEEFAVEFEKQWFLLTSAEEVKTFRAKPASYVPQFMGCDPVLLWDKSQVPAVRGLTRHAAFYDDQLYLFSTAENRDLFKQSPDKYIITRLVLDLDLIETVTQ